MKRKNIATICYALGMIGYIAFATVINVKFGMIAWLYCLGACAFTMLFTLGICYRKDR